MVKEQIRNNVRSWTYFHSSEKKWPTKAEAITEDPSTIVSLKRHPLKNEASPFICKLVDGYSAIYLIVLNRNNINTEELLILEFFIKKLFYSLDIWKQTRCFAHRWLSVTSYSARPRRIILKDINTLIECCKLTLAHIFVLLWLFRFWHLLTMIVTFSIKDVFHRCNWTNLKYNWK